MSLFWKETSAGHEAVSVGWNWIFGICEGGRRPPPFSEVGVHFKAKLAWSGLYIYLWFMHLEWLAHGSPALDDHAPPEPAVSVFWSKWLVSWTWSCSKMQAAAAPAAAPPPVVAGGVAASRRCGIEMKRQQRSLWIIHRSEVTHRSHTPPAWRWAAVGGWAGLQASKLKGAHCWCWKRPATRCSSRSGSWIMDMMMLFFPLLYTTPLVE